MPLFWLNTENHFDHSGFVIVFKCHCGQQLWEYSNSFNFYKQYITTSFRRNIIWSHVIFADVWVSYAFATNCHQFSGLNKFIIFSSRVRSPKWVSLKSRHHQNSVTLEAVEKGPLPCLFLFLAAACIAWLMASFLRLQRQQSSVF